MNREAEKHLDEARRHEARGRAEYLAAGREIVAAQQADQTLTQRQISERMGVSQAQVSRLVALATSDSPGNHDMWSRGSHATKDEIAAGAERLLRDAPMEQVERLFDDLPPDRKKKLAAAAGDSYFQRRTEFDERERNLTPTQRSEREAGRQVIHTQVAKALAPLQVTLGVANYLGLATELLKEMVSDQTLTPEFVEEIERADAEWRNELEVARAMAGLEVT